MDAASQQHEKLSTSVVAPRGNTRPNWVVPLEGAFKVAA